MNAGKRSGRLILLAGGSGVLILGVTAWLTAAPPVVVEGHPGGVDVSPEAGPGCPGGGEWEGTWYWLRSPDQERRAIAGLFNRYCIRCHGTDGRGIWDMPDIPDFTNERWQACRSDGQLARIILEGRGAVMPPFRGTLSLEEAWAMARYLRTFVPGSEASRPDFGKSDAGRREKTPEMAPAPKKETLPAPRGEAAEHQPIDPTPGAGSLVAPE